MKDQAQSLRELARAAGRFARRARVVTVTSGKGGVGKTNLSVNLGVALVRRGLRVVVVDADLGLANVDIVLGVDPELTLMDVLYSGRSVEEVLVQAPGGLRVLAGGSGVYELAVLPPAELGRLLQQVERLDSMFDVILIDTGAGLGDNVLQFALASEEVVVVTTTDPTALADAYAVIKTITLRKATPRWRVVVNMAPDAREGEATFRRLQAATQRFLGLAPELLGIVPRDEAVHRAMQRQVPFVLSSPHVPASRAIDAMARRLVGAPEPEPTGLGGLLRRLVGLRR